MLGSVPFYCRHGHLAVSGSSDCGNCRREFVIEELIKVLHEPIVVGTSVS